MKQASDTLHPRKMRCSVDGSALSRNIEDMMKIIAAQGRVIEDELTRMNEGSHLAVAASAVRL